jgi:hypothetical protein
LFNVIGRVKDYSIDVSVYCLKFHQYLIGKSGRYSRVRKPAGLPAAAEVWLHAAFYDFQRMETIGRSPFSCVFFAGFFYAGFFADSFLCRILIMQNLLLQNLYDTVSL